MLPLSSELFRCFSDFFHLTLMLTLLIFQCLAKSVNLEQSTSYKEVSGQFWKSSRSATQPWDFPLTNMKQSKFKTLLPQSSRSFRSSASIWETSGFTECERQWIAAGGQRSNSNKRLLRVQFHLFLSFLKSLLFACGEMSLLIHFPKAQLES